MARHSTGIGLDLFCWLNSDEPVTPVTLDKTQTELTGAGSGLWCQYLKKIKLKKTQQKSHCVYAHISIIQQLILGFRNKTWVTVKKRKLHRSDPFFDTVLLFSVSQYHQEQNKCEAAVTVEEKSNVPMISNEHGTFKFKLTLNFKLQIN